MNKKYLDQLLPDNKKLLWLIESHLGKEISVCEVPGGKKLACDIQNLTILTPEGKFPDSSVLHELLHFRRFKIDGVPELAVCDAFNFSDPNFETDLTRLDNNIEHLFIVPEEICLRPNRLAYWKNRIYCAIKTQESSCLDINSHGCDAVMNWIFANRIIGTGAVVENATKIIQELNCEPIAKKLLSILKQPNCNKEIFSKILLPKLNLPNGSVCLKYIDREESLRTES